MFPFIYNNTGIHDDKVLHFIFGFIISFGLYNFLKRKIQNKYQIFGYMILIMLIISIGKETLDFFIPGRNVEIADILTNYIGMGFFLGILKIKDFKQKIFK